jgi:flagellar biosynthetic protein FlhB
MLLITFGTLKIGTRDYTLYAGLVHLVLSDSVVVQNAGKRHRCVGVQYYKGILFSVLPMILPFFLVVMVGGAAVHVMQSGPMFITSKLKPDFKKINPLSGFKRIFSIASVMELFKSIIKIIILSWIAYSYLSPAIKKFIGFIYVDVGKAISTVLSESFSMGIMIGLALIAFAAIDLLYQWWKFEKDIRDDEAGSQGREQTLEGDPQVKGKIRQKQRKMSMQRMMQRLPESTVVVTNPEHFAVALR